MFVCILRWTYASIILYYLIDAPPDSCFALIRSHQRGIWKLTNLSLMGPIRAKQLCEGLCLLISDWHRIPILNFTLWWPTLTLFSLAAHLLKNVQSKNTLLYSFVLLCAPKESILTSVRHHKKIQSFSKNSFFDTQIWFQVLQVV